MRMVNMHDFALPTRMLRILSTLLLFLPAVVGQGQCCSWDFKVCGDNDWCNQNSQNCDACLGFWIHPRTDACTARWETCTTDKECCDLSLHCVELDGYKGCGLSEDQGPCCSWNLKDCDPDQNCGKDKTTCEQTCGWTWIDPDPSYRSCTARFGGCSTDTDCCPGSKCVNIVADDNSTFVGCGMPQDTNDDYCCTFNFAQCDVNWNCNGSEENCTACNGYWRDVTNDPGCLARYKYCDNTTAACCPGLKCVHIDDYTGCGLSVDTHDDTCCMYNFKDCDVGSWCSQSASNCAVCNGWWIDPDTVRANCTGRWGSCTSDDECCGWGNVKCVNMTDGNYMGCGIANDTHDDSCCSWDFQNCGDSDWCNNSTENCASCQGGFWIDPSDNSNCTRRYKNCVNDTQCCGSLKCVKFADYLGCGIPLIDTPCCSWDFKKCDTGAGADYCSASQDNCAICTGFWIDPSRTQLCTARYQPCTDSKTCCEGTTCMLSADGSNICGIPGDEYMSGSNCCSWDLKTCATNLWCSASQANCDICQAYWITPADRQDCTARWEACTTDSQCCPDSKCIQLNGYKGCGIAGVDA